MQTKNGMQPPLVTVNRHLDFADDPIDGPQDAGTVAPFDSPRAWQGGLAMSKFTDSAPSRPIAIASQLPPPRGGLIRAAEYVRMRVEFIAKLRERGALVENESRQVIVIDGRCRVTLTYARYRHGPRPAHWQVQDFARPNWAFIACEDQEGNGVQSYWLVGGGLQWMQIGATFHRRKPRLWSVTMDPLADFLAGRARTESPRSQLQLVGVTQLGGAGPSIPFGSTEVGDASRIPAKIG